MYRPLILYYMSTGREESTNGIFYSCLIEDMEECDWSTGSGYITKENEIKSVYKDYIEGLCFFKDLYSELHPWTA